METTSNNESINVQQTTDLSGQVNNQAATVQQIVGEAVNKPLAVAFREHSAETEEQGWHVNTNLDCDVKTWLRSDKRMVVNKEYPGILRLDSEADIDYYRCRDPHMTFIETTLSSYAGRRNTCIYEGKHLTCTKRLNSTARLNFKSLKQNVYSDIDNFATEVANEIREALKAFVEE